MVRNRLAPKGRKPEEDISCSQNERAIKVVVGWHQQNKKKEVNEKKLKDRLLISDCGNSTNLIEITISE